MFLKLDFAVSRFMQLFLTPQPNHHLKRDFYCEHPFRLTLAKLILFSAFFVVMILFRYTADDTFFPELSDESKIIV